MPPLPLKKFKRLQKHLSRKVRILRDRYYNGTIPLNGYETQRVKIFKELTDDIALLFGLSAFQAGWRKHYAKETLKKELALVPFKVGGITDKEKNKLCIIQARHARQFFGKKLLQHAPMLTGKDYMIDEFKHDFWFVSDEESQLNKDEVDNAVGEIWP